MRCSICRKKIGEKYITFGIKKLCGEKCVKAYYDRELQKIKEKRKDIVLKKKRSKKTAPKAAQLHNIWANVIKTKYPNCIICGAKNNLDAHHIFERGKHQDMNIKLKKYYIENGVTLCRYCHINAHKDIDAFMFILKSKGIDIDKIAKFLRNNRKVKDKDVYDYLSGNLDII